MTQPKIEILNNKSETLLRFTAAGLLKAASIQGAEISPVPGEYALRITTEGRCLKIAQAQDLEIREFPFTIEPEEDDPDDLAP